MRRNTVISIVILLVVFALSSAVLAQKGTALRVVVVKTDNVPAYVQDIEKGRQLSKSMGLQGQVGVWRARFAGPEAGTVVGSIEYPKMAALATDDAKGN